jgi:hypothetical protein
MTQPEQNAAIGELVKTYSDAKQKRAAIIAELHSAGNILKAFGYQLESNLEHRAGRPFPSVPANYPDGDRLRRLLDELSATDDTIARCKRLLADAGLQNID